METFHEETCEGTEASIRMFQSAVDLDQNYCDAWARLGWCHARLVMLRCVEDLSLSLERGFEVLEFRHDCGRDAVGDFVLNVEDVLQLTIEALGPDMVAGLCINSISKNPDIRTISLLHFHVIDFYLQGGPSGHGQPFVDFKLGVAF